MSLKALAVVAEGGRSSRRNILKYIKRSRRETVLLAVQY